MFFKGTLKSPVEAMEIWKERVIEYKEAQRASTTTTDAVDGTNELEFAGRKAR